MNRSVCSGAIDGDPLACVMRWQNGFPLPTGRCGPETAVVEVSDPAGSTSPDQLIDRKFRPLYDLG